MTLEHFLIKKGKKKKSITDKPEVRAGHRWIYSAPGIRAQLECQVVAWPEARLEWYFDGNKLERSRRFLRMKEDLGSNSVQLYTLVIRNLQDSDMGQYTCVAANEKGRAEAVVEVSGVPRPPHLKRGASSGTSYLFIWEVESYTRIVQYELWFKQVRAATAGSPAVRRPRDSLILSILAHS